MKTTTTWKTGQAFDTYQNEAKLEIDAKAGFSPKALLLSGLAACSGIDVVEILEKMRVPFADLTVDAEADQTETHPRVFKDIQLTYHLAAAEENRDKIRKAIELSLSTYCGVAAMLKKNSEINYTIELKELP
jgi:putative redox protein